MSPKLTLFMSGMYGTGIFQPSADWDYDDEEVELVLDRVEGQRGWWVREWHHQDKTLTAYVGEWYPTLRAAKDYLAQRGTID